MQDIKQPGIVVGGVNYSDSSRVLWLLTPEYGRQALMVKGARRVKSRYRGVLETFNLLEVVYRPSRSGSLHTLKEADAVNQFRGLRRDLDSFMAASRAVELIKAVAPEDQRSPELFHLLEDFLCCADETSGEAGMAALLLVSFRWRLLSLVGLEPQLTDCIRCGNRLQRQDSYRFQPAAGGVLCDSCAGEPESGGGRLLLDYPALRFIYRSVRKFPLPHEELSALGRSDFEQAETAADRYDAYHIGERRRTGESK